MLGIAAADGTANAVLVDGLTATANELIANVGPLVGPLLTVAFGVFIAYRVIRFVVYEVLAWHDGRH